MRRRIAVIAAVIASSRSGAIIAARPVRRPPIIGPESPCTRLQAIRRSSAEAASSGAPSGGDRAVPRASRSKAAPAASRSSAPSQSSRPASNASPDGTGSASARSTQPSPLAIRWSVGSSPSARRRASCALPSRRKAARGERRRAAPRASPKRCAGAAWPTPARSARARSENPATPRSARSASASVRSAIPVAAGPRAPLAAGRLGAAASVVESAAPHRFPSPSAPSSDTGRPSPTDLAPTDLAPTNLAPTNLAPTDLTV